MTSPSGGGGGSVSVCGSVLFHSSLRRRKAAAESWNRYRTRPEVVVHLGFLRRTPPLCSQRAARLGLVAGRIFSP